MTSIINKIKRIITKRKLRGHDISTSRNVFHQILLYLLYTKNKKLITNNKSIKNSYSGQRCFILFTGTSIKDFNFDLIGDEKVIATGMAFLHKDFKKCNTVAYFNPAPWEPRSLLFFDFFAGCVFKNTNQGCNVFFDTTAHPYINEVLSTRVDDTYYMSNNATYISSKDIEFELHNFNNIQEGSLPCGLGIAAYMGFKEIYLLGQDFLTDPPIYGHFYDGYNESGNPSDYESYRERASWMIDHIKKKGCKVINVVQDENRKSSLDSVTFQDLESFLN
jgi:hypothetical protein